MLKKNYTKSGRFCRVTFKLQSDVDTEKVALCGDFNGWDTTANPMKKRADGSFSTTVTLPVNRKYRFKYCLDANSWENDGEADGYVENEYGSEDSIIKV